MAQAAEVFNADLTARRDGAPPLDVKTLHAKIGQQALEIDFLAGALGQPPGSSATLVIDRHHHVPVTQQARLLALSRASVYYMYYNAPRGVRRRPRAHALPGCAASRTPVRGQSHAAKISSAPRGT